MDRLLERDGELARIGELITAAADGRGAVLAIEGPAGIGKTQLMESAHALARDRGMRGLSARGAELETDFAFGIGRQLFEPVLGESVASDEGGAGLGVLHKLYRATAALAGKRPLLVTVDDAHWAD